MLKFRLDSTTSSLMERARSYVGLDKSKFIRQSIREQSEAIIAEHEQSNFTADDWHMFFDMMDNPPQPTERMKKATIKYQQIVSS